MGKTAGKLKWLTKWFVAFLAIAVVFLAIGLGTLGSADATLGKAFELKTERDSDPFSVVIELKNDGFTDPETGDSYKLRVKDIYVNVGIIYADAGTPAKLRLDYSSSATSFTSATRRYDATFENLYTEKTEAAEDKEENAPDVTDGLFRWVKPFQSLTGTWVSTYPTYRYVKLTALTHDMLINEIVFVGEKYDTDNKALGETQVMPATIKSATPNSEETPEEAALRAGALVDMQRIPSEAQSSFYGFTESEVYTLSTIAEMKRGGEYDSAVAPSAYRVEGVYGSLGIDIIALGTEIFGLTPFGLRFFPMLASFGVLVFGFLLLKQLTKSERAGVFFAALYALCNLSFSLGHLGTPLMIGVFFFVASLYFCHRFYARGMKKAGGASVLPPVFAGLFAAAAISVNGAYLIPVAGIVALFVCGMVRQQKAKRHYLALALSGEGIAEEPEADPEQARKERAAEVMREYRTKNLAAGVGFGLTLVLGSVLFAVLFAIPLYAPFMHLYSSSSNIFALAALVFAGGFAGSNPGAALPAWDLFGVIFRGTGTSYAVTAICINAAAAVIGVLGIGYAVYRLIRILRKKEWEKAERTELRTIAVPLIGLILCLIMTAFGGGSLGFLLLTYVFAFALAAYAAGSLWEGKYAKIVKIGSIAALVLLIVVFALYAAFTFSIPASASLIVKLIR